MFRLLENFMTIFVVGNVQIIRLLSKISILKAEMALFFIIFATLVAKITSRKSMLSPTLSGFAIYVVGIFISPSAFGISSYLSRTFAFSEKTT